MVPWSLVCGYQCQGVWCFLQFFISHYSYYLKLRSVARRREWNERSWV